MIEDKLHKNKLTYFAAKHTNSCQKNDETSKKIVKETHKSQVYDVKNKTFINFALVREKEINMVIARLIKEKLSSIPAGIVLTTRDFGVEMRYQPALAKALNRLVLQGELQKIAKGKYYIPKKTIFGNLKPADSELVKDFLEQNGKIVGYITGTTAFAAMGLTTQISSSVLVGTNKYRRPITRNGVKISFLLQENAITSSNIPLLRILDALRLIKDIPATSPDECVANIYKAINALSKKQKQELAELSLAYTPYVRALLGAIYENMELETETVSKTLNGVTSYKLPISDKVLANKRNWNII